MKRLNIPMKACLALLALGAAAMAQDPPSRVARLAYMTGPVSFEPASVDQWTQASLNYPMTTGDNLYTDQGARAVLRIGRNSLRLNGGTNFQFVNLSDQVVQVSINSGSLSVRVRHLFPGETWEVDTPDGAVTLVRPGEYRIDTDPNQNATMVTTRNGEAQVTANDQSFPVLAQQTAYFGPDGNPDIRDQNPNDDFDSFAYSRDRLEDVPPPQYVSPDLEGYEDLNAYGSWRNDPDYGPVWIPQVEEGWAPYHNGRWAWVDPWGWTWVDQATWGFAPFHYGRWAFVGGAWGWCPGPVAVRPVYAPALVAFIGGSGFGIGIGGGGISVGWFPLGPRDPFIPSYTVSQAYVRNVNISNTRITNINITNVNVTNINYMNRNVAGAVVAMPQQAFASAQPVQRSAIRVTPQQLQQAQVVGMAPRVVPQRAAVLASVGTSRVVAPPANIASRPVVARLTPPPAPVSFQAKQALLQQNPGRPVAPQQLQTLRQQAPAAAVPNRVAVRPINTAQVHAITPTVKPGAVSGGFTGQRAIPANQPGSVRPPASPQAQPGQRFGQPVPSRTPPQAVTPAPQARPQAAPPVQQTRPQPAPPVRPQAEPPVRQAAPQAVREPAPPPRQVQQAPPPRPAPQQAPAARPAPPAQRPAPEAQPQRQPPPPQKKPAPPPPKEEKKDDKKQ